VEKFKPWKGKEGMSEVQYKAEQKFGPLTSNGDFWRSKCPECGNKDKSISIHKESGYYHCWHESCETLGYVDGDQNISFNTMEKTIEPPILEQTSNTSIPFKSIDDSDYESQRQYFLDHRTKVIKHLKLPWDESVAIDDKFNVGFNRRKKRLVFGISNRGFLGHIKEHKGPQFGHDKSNKIYPEAILEQADPNQLLFIVEGEKDVITALSNEIMAVSFTAGAGSVPEDISTLDPYQNIVICYDNDKAGREGAEKTARALAITKPNRKIRIYKWGNVPPGYDLTDYFESGSRDGFITGLEDSYEFGHTASDFGGMSTMSIFDYLDIKDTGPGNVCSEILIERGISTIAGTSNVGKSILALQFAVSVAMGVDFMAFHVPRPRRVYFAQFEMMDSMVRDRGRKIIKAMLEKYPDKKDLLSKNLDMNTVDTELKLFTDKWEALRGNMMSGMKKGKYDVLVVDNLYTSTNINIFDNEKLKFLLQTIRSVQLEFDLSILLINHHNKQYGEKRPLDQDQIRGGKLFTDFVDNASQVAISPMRDGLRIFKVTKVRTESEFHEKPMAIILEAEDDRLQFKWLGPLGANEVAYYGEAKESLDHKVHQECISYSGDDGIIDTKQFFAIMEEHTEYSESTIFRWLSKFVKHGRFEKRRSGQYYVKRDYLPEL